MLSAATWRLPYGEAGILGFFLAAVASPGAPHDLLQHSLRLIGNCCAETDDNRGRVVDQNYLPSLIRQLRDPLLVHVAIPVLYNICVDHGACARWHALAFPLTVEERPHSFEQRITSLCHI